jgi:hypothetical protein
MGISYNTSIVSDGLIFALDAANSRSYSGSGITVNGLVGGIGATLVNGVGFGITNGGNFNLDGTNDYIMAQDVSSLNLTSDLTAIIWFKITTFPGNDWVRVIGKGDITNRSFGFWYNSGSPNVFLYQRYGTSNVSILISTTLQLNTWYQGAVTSGGSTHRMYINGVEIGNATTTPPFNSSTSLLKLGYGDVHQYHNGQISQALIYDRALSAQEIKQNYNATKKRYI